MSLLILEFSKPFSQLSLQYSFTVTPFSNGSGYQASNFHLCPLLASGYSAVSATGGGGEDYFISLLCELNEMM